MPVLSSRRNHAQAVPRVGLPKHSVDLAGAEDVLEDVLVGRGRAVSAAAAVALVGRGRRGRRGRPPGLLGPVLLLGNLVQDVTRGALARILKHKDHVDELAAQLRVEQEHVPPQLGQLLRGVAVAVAQAKVAHDHAVVAVVQADAQRAAQLVPRHVALLGEGVLEPAVFQLRPARGRHRHHGQVVPAVQALVAVVRPAAHHDRVGEDAALRRDRVVARLLRGRPRRAERGRQVAAPAELLLVADAARLPVSSGAALVGGAEKGHADAAAAHGLAGLSVGVGVVEGAHHGVAHVDAELGRVRARLAAGDGQLGHGLAVQEREGREHVAVALLDEGDEVSLGVGRHLGRPDPVGSRGGHDGRFLRISHEAEPQRGGEIVYQLGGGEGKVEECDVYRWSSYR